MTAERWLPIPGYDGYEVSDQGRVWSHKTSRFLRPATIRRDASASTTYLSVCLYSSTGSRPWTVHRLVMLAFVGPCPDGLQTRHLNGDSMNNALDNLAYGTASENNIDTVRTGHHRKSQQTHCLRGHEYTPENTDAEVRGKGISRTCKECRRMRERRRYAHRKALTQSGRTDVPLAPTG